MLRSASEISPSLFASAEISFGRISKCKFLYLITPTQDLVFIPCLVTFRAFL